MSILNINVTPSVTTVARMGTNFQLLSGGEITVRFLFADGDQEQVTVRVGDSLKYSKPYVKFEVSSVFQLQAEMYAGYADMRRAKQDLTPVGTTSLISSSKALGKTEDIIISDNADRRSVIIFPLNDTIYVGSIGTSQNDKVPVPIGASITIETSAAIYGQLDTASAFTTADVRILEEVN
jgi:hypothetical protein